MTTPTDDAAGHDYATVTDGRSVLLRWWHRRSIVRFKHEGNFVARIIVRLNPLQAMLVLFGRSIEVEIRSAASDDVLSKACEGFTAESRTIPRRWL